MVDPIRIVVETDGTQSERELKRQAGNVTAYSKSVQNDARQIVQTQQRAASESRGANDKVIASNTRVKTSSHEVATAHATDSRRIRQSNDSAIASFLGLEHTGVRAMDHLRRTAHLAIGVSGLGGLAFGLKDLTQEAVKAEAEQAKLGRAVKNAGFSWNVHKKSIEGALDKLSEFSGFAKSDLSSSLANMLRTTGSISEAFKANAIAMDIARTKGMDLQGAQSLVARAYLGNTRGLKSLGVAITPVTTQQDKLKASTSALTREIRLSHGDRKLALEDQKQSIGNLEKQARAQDAAATATRAVGLLQQKFSGQAAAYAKTDAGRFEQARASLQIAEETIGQQLLPSFASAAKEVAKLAQSFTEHWPEIKKEISDTVDPVWKVAKGIGEFVGHNPELQRAGETIAAIALSYKAIKGFGNLTGITGLAKDAGKVTGLSGGLATKATPVPVFVTNMGGLPGGSGPGGALTDAEKVAGGAGAATVVKRAAGEAASRGATALKRGLAVEIAAQVVGHMVGGHKGSEITRRGGDVAAGAAIGSIFGPGGTAVGALGGLIASGGGSPAAQAMRNLHSIGDAAADQQKQVAALDDTIGKLEDRWAKVDQSGPGANVLRTEIDNMKHARDELAKTAAAFGATAGTAGDKLSVIRKTVATTTAQIRKNFGSDTAGAQKALATNFALAEQAIQKSMDAGVIATGKGTAEIDRLFVKQLKAYGLTSSQANALSTNGTLQPSASRVPGQALSPGAAGGMLQRLPGTPGPDSIPMSVNGQHIMAAPGEDVAVITRHQRKYLDRRLAREGGLSGVMRGITTKHNAAREYASGGIVTGDTDYLPAVGSRLNAMSAATHTPIHVASGRRTLAEQAILYAKYLAGTGNLAAKPDANAPHVRGIAADISPGREKFGSIAGRFGLGFTVPSESWHIQLLDAAVASGAIGAGEAKRLKRTLFHGPGGSIGKLGQAGLDRGTVAAQHRLDQIAASMGGNGANGDAGVGPAALPHGGGGSASANIKLGREMAAKYGWTGAQFSALQSLWQGESGWNDNSVNPSSGAYGIPQALGHGHPYALGDASAQIAWGLNYIQQRYGSPSAAYSAWLSRSPHWYSQGGIVGAAGGLLATEGAGTAGLPGGKPGKSKKPKLPRLIKGDKKAKKRKWSTDQLFSKLKIPADAADSTKGIWAQMTKIESVDLDNLDRRISAMVREQARSDEDTLISNLLDTNPDGTPKLNQDQVNQQFAALVQQHVGELDLQIPLHQQILADYDNPAGGLTALADHLHGDLDKGLAERIQRVADIKDTAERNAKRIQALNNDYSNEKKKNLGWQDKIKTNDSRITQFQADLRAERAKVHRDPDTIDNLHTQITAMSQENTRLRRDKPPASKADKARETRLSRQLSWSRDLQEALVGQRTADVDLSGAARGFLGDARKSRDSFHDAIYKTPDGIIDKQRLLPFDRQSAAGDLQDVLDQKADWTGRTSPQVGPASAGSDNGLAALYQQQAQDALHALAVSNSQFDVFKNFAPLLSGRMLGTFAQGLYRPVTETGLAILHRGETVHTDPQGGYGNQIAGDSGGNAGPVTVHLTLGDNTGGLVRLIDARVDGRAAKVVSQQLGQQTRRMSAIGGAS